MWRKVMLSASEGETPTKELQTKRDSTTIKRREIPTKQLQKKEDTATIKQRERRQTSICKHRRVSASEGGTPTKELQTKGDTTTIKTCIYYLINFNSYLYLYLL